VAPVIAGKEVEAVGEAIDEIMKQTERASESDSGECRLPEELQQRQQLREEIQKQLQQLKEKDRDHVNPGDEDARMMKCRAGKKFAWRVLQWRIGRENMMR